MLLALDIFFLIMVPGRTLFVWAGKREMNGSGPGNSQSWVIHSTSTPKVLGSFCIFLILGIRKQRSDRCYIFDKSWVFRSECSYER
ncbi:uncharacterized protein CCOS01_16025 [Colletotrichum costaricense]|uniref:Uncharacterized protein n=1 Tax=Colletotrichum costaricense TaxID=1209916 RepID=A0AAI9YG54_9PEZI|nr:uncharacterized protein CCOS01_16025 [Colletotrichum costaricense]KAK1508024.1 hypothetical protein CCOS01_16025 [Colletotrichum costaricense]